MVVNDRGQTRRTSWRYKTPRAKCAAKHAADQQAGSGEKQGEANNTRMLRVAMAMPNREHTHTPVDTHTQQKTETPHRGKAAPLER